MVAVVGGFVAVVVPLFAAGGGTPRAEVAGALPSTVAQGAHVRADIAIDNVGDSVIAPVCVAVSGAHLVSADFQGLDLVTATADRACGGELTGQETIGVTIVLTLPTRGNVSVRIVPAQGSTTIGPALVGTVTVT